MGNTAAEPADPIVYLDLATVLLASVGVFIAFAQPPEPDIEMGRAGLFMTNLTLALALFQDHRRARKEGAVRAFTPTPKRLAASSLILLIAAAVCFHRADATGYGWIWFGFFLSGVAFTGQRMVLIRSS